jgi:hypothetical protein
MGYKLAFGVSAVPPDSLIESNIELFCLLAYWLPWFSGCCTMAMTLLQQRGGACFKHAVSI